MKFSTIVESMIKVIRKHFNKDEILISLVYEKLQVNQLF